MAALRNIFLVLLLGAVALSQYAYDLQRVKSPAVHFPLSRELVKTFDIGLHSAVASFLWIDTISELPFLREGYPKFRDDLKLINDLDPRFSFPYAFTVLVLPAATSYPDRLNATIETGKRGIKEADPDWRVPFYLATTYHLELKDRVNASLYFDTAARTPGAPFYIRRFSLNYNLSPTLRDQNRQIWTAIYNTSDSDYAKERAKLYLLRFDVIDYLEAAAKTYKAKIGHFPKIPQDLLAEKIIPEVPRDPFGFQFNFDPKGIIGIVKD